LHFKAVNIRIFAKINRQKAKDGCLWHGWTKPGNIRVAETFRLILVEFNFSLSSPSY
jgi:hypothetical protein